MNSSINSIACMTRATSNLQRRAQSGIVLVIVMMMLILVTSIALISARKAILDEGGARNSQDAEAARQAAEAALRDAERDLMAIVINAAKVSCSRPDILQFDVDCPQGLCRKDNDKTYSAVDWANATSSSSVTAEPWWPISKGGLWDDPGGNGEPNNNKPGRTPVTSANCTFKGAVPLGTYTGVDAMQGVAYQPEYLIEYFSKKVLGGKEADAYRITARGFGYTRRTQSVLQTIFTTSGD